MRRALGIAYVTDPTLPIDAVARCLGFADRSAFARAFRRWTHTSPTEYRVAAPRADRPASCRASAPFVSSEWVPRARCPCLHTWLLRRRAATTPAFATSQGSHHANCRNHPRSLGSSSRRRARRRVDAPGAGESAAASVESPPRPPSSAAFYVNVTGAKQGAFAGESTAKAHLGSSNT